jgi:hypothetical protein
VLAAYSSVVATVNTQETSAGLILVSLSAVVASALPFKSASAELGRAFGGGGRSWLSLGA